MARGEGGKLDSMWTVIGVLGAVVTFGIAGFMRKLAVDRIHPYQMQVVAGIVYAGVVPVWLWVIEREPLVGDYDRVGVGYAVACLLMNMLGSVMLGSLLKSSDSSGGITVLTAMYPVVTGLLCWGLLGEEYTLRKVIAVVLMLCGVVLFSY
jgi:uncharacterized membrane protein